VSSSGSRLPNSRTRNDIVFLLIGSFCFCVLGIHLGSLASWDEAYYAVVSRGIFLNGDWVRLRFFDTPFYDKPPFYMWLTAAFYHLGGVNEFTSRLGSALAGMGTVLVTYFLGRRLFGRAVGLAGAGVLVSSTDFLHYARFGTLDVTNLFFFTLVIYGFIRALKRPDFWYLFWAASGLAVLNKGPLIVLAWGVAGIHCLLEKDFSFLKKRQFWLGLVLALGIVLPWHLAAYAQDPKKFVQDFIIKHYIARTGSAVEGHEGNYYYYIRRLINKHHPWIVLAPVSLPLFLWRSFRGPGKQAYRLIVSWVLIVLVFFTFLVKTKLPWYILPLLPALCIAGGVVLADLFKQHFERIIKPLVALVLILHLPFSGVMVRDYVPGLKRLSAQVQNAVPEGRTVFLFNYHEQPAALFYLKRSARYLDSVGELDEVLEPGKPLWLVTLRTEWQAHEQDLTARGMALAGSAGEGKEAVVLALYRDRRGV